MEKPSLTSLVQTDRTHTVCTVKETRGQQYILGGLEPRPCPGRMKAGVAVAS